MISLILLLILVTSCTSEKENSKIRAVVEDYYQVYQQRTNFQRFLSFYDEQMQFEDIILGERYEDKPSFAKFFDWGNPDFYKLDTLTLIIEDQIIENNQVVSKGYFTPFKWGDATFEAMYFLTVLTFNDAGKIVKHTDWINYPKTLVDYNTRKNANSWIKHEVLKTK